MFYSEIEVFGQEFGQEKGVTYGIYTVETEKRHKMGSMTKKKVVRNVER